MARDVDYKNIRQAGVQDRQPVEHKRIRLFLSGVVLGVVVSALATVVYFNYAPELHLNPSAVACKPRSATTQQADTSEVDSYPYDFFDILQSGIVLPEPEVEDSRARSTYLLQAGSFHTQHKAEVFQQQIKAIGFDSEVVMSEGNDNVWYVVTIGPDDSLSRINNIKLKLRTKGIEPLIIKR